MLGDKLAWIMCGWANDEPLDTGEADRPPVVWVYEGDERISTSADAPLRNASMRA